jgi:hypothetical protein
VRTVLSNIQFRNFALQANVESERRPAVWFTMRQSDEFKPSVSFKTGSLNRFFSKGSCRFFCPQEAA